VTARLDAGDGLVAHATRADGEAIVWLHGYTMDATVFTDLWAALPGWRHVGLDLPGHGSSRPLRAEDDLQGLAVTIADFAEAAGARHLAGLSFGTLVALQVAAARPEAFSTLVLAAPGLAGAPTDAAVTRRYLELARLYHRAGPGPHMTELWMRSPPDIFRHAMRRPALGARLAALVDRHSWLELQGFAMRRLAEGEQGEALLARVRAATLVLVGEHELAAHVACARAIAAAVPGALVDVLADCGHLALLEEPETAAACIAAHLTRSPSASAR
jgi:2-succinyl-6-hydroxy-2,4-cyclohexadiene-1-carboxylate synthase